MIYLIRPSPESNLTTTSNFDTGINNYEDSHYYAKLEKYHNVMELRGINTPNNMFVFNSIRSNYERFLQLEQHY